MSQKPTSALTIVSGIPRAGTAMMMHMIDAGGIPALTDSVRAANEDNPHGYFEYEPVKRTSEDAGWLEDAVGKVVKLVHLLLMDLPLDRQYDVVFIRRSLEEVVRSQNAMLARAGKKREDDLSDERVQEIFRAQLHEVEQFLDSHPNFNVLFVNHNEIIKDPRSAAESVNQFLGGRLDVEKMAAIVDPSLYRQRR
ncbi:MAG: sulfotransferase domain-containing protein [Planctomycetota bacterium]